MGKNEGTELVDDLHKLKSERNKQAFLSSTPVLVIKGFGSFAYGLFVVIVCGFSAWQAHYRDFPMWWRVALTVSAAFVVVPGLFLLGKFFRAVGEAK